MIFNAISGSSAQLPVTPIALVRKKNYRNVYGNNKSCISKLHSFGADTKTTLYLQQLQGTLRRIPETFFERAIIRSASVTKLINVPCVYNTHQWA